MSSLKLGMMMMLHHGHGSNLHAYGHNYDAVCIPRSTRFYGVSTKFVPGNALQRRGNGRMLTVASSVYEETLPAHAGENSPSPSNGYRNPAFSLKPSAVPSHPKEGTNEPKEDTNQHIHRFEAVIEQAIFNCRFFTLMGVVGSLAGSVLCFLKGCSFVVESFAEYFKTCLHGHGTGKVMLLLVEAVDVYLMGTVMLIFGMGLYELFVSSLEVAGGNSGSRIPNGSNLFGLFRLRERPKWLEIHSLDELKTKLGHVIVMILLVGMFDKSKKVPVHSGVDLLYFSASILLLSGCLFLLSKLHSTN